MIKTKHSQHVPALLAAGGAIVIGIALLACSRQSAAAPTAAAPGSSSSSAAATMTTRHRVVVELTTNDQEQWQAALNNLQNLRKAFGESNVDLELVAHGNGLAMLVAAGGGERARMEELSKGGVVFAACENTMRKKNVTKEDLMPFVTTVDSGVAEVVRKQEAGWAYLKSSR